VRNLAADADLTLEGRSGTSSRTSTAAHSFWPSQDPELAGVIDDLPDHLPAAVALHQYRCEPLGSDGVWTNVDQAGLDGFVGGASEPSWPSDSAKLATHLSQMKTSRRLAISS
jgi:hypothetical protein